MMKCIVCALVAFSSIATVTLGKAGEVCFPFGHVTNGETGNQPPVSQGRPGKSGATGASGAPGPQGVAGPPGQCACDPSEIEQLNENIQELRKLQASYCNVGMEDGRIPDSSITASGMYDSRFAPSLGRLNNQPAEGVHYGCWIGGPHQSTTNVGEWIQVRLEVPTHVTGVITQGRPTKYNQYTTGYNIAHGNSTENMQIILDTSGSAKVFQGNRDSSRKVTNMLNPPITAKYFRLIVQTWNHYPAIRMELLTC